MFPTCSPGCRGDHPFRCSQRWGPNANMGERPARNKTGSRTACACTSCAACVRHVWVSRSGSVRLPLSLPVAAKPGICCRWLSFNPFTDLLTVVGGKKTGFIGTNVFCWRDRRVLGTRGPGWSSRAHEAPPTPPRLCTRCFTLIGLVLEARH